MKKQTKQKEFFSLMIVKTLLAILLFTGMAVIIIGGGYIIVRYTLISPDKTDLPIINPVVEAQCEIDTDCNIVFTGPYISCNSPEEYYECLNISKYDADVINQNKKRLDVMCPDRIDKYICKCENGKCEKVKEELVEGVIITTDKTEYSTNDKIDIEITNNISSDIFFAGPDDCPASLKFYGSNNSDNIWQDMTPKWTCLLTKEKMIFNESIDLNFDFKYFSNLNYDQYRLEFVYSSEEVDDIHELLEKADKVYSNEFTIKEKSVVDTSDWQTYQHQATGVRFQHPRDWQIVQNQSENHMIFNKFYLRKDSQEIEILKSSDSPPETMDMKSVESHKVLVDGYKSNIELFQGKFDNNKDKYYLRVFISEKDIFYHAKTDKDNLEELSLIFNQILSTLKFID